MTERLLLHEAVLVKAWVNNTPCEANSSMLGVLIEDSP